MADESRPPLSDSLELEEIPAPLPGWDVEWIHLGPGPMSHSGVRVAFGAGSATAFHATRPCILRGSSANDRRALLAGFPATQPLRTRARVLGNDNCLLLGPASRIDLYLPEGSAALMLGVAAEQSAVAAPAAGESQVRTLSAPQTALLARCMESLDNLRAAACAPQVEREASPRLRDLLQSTWAAVLREAAPQPRRTDVRSLRHLAVTRACNFIDAHLREPIALADLCAAAGVCTRTLEYGFRDFYDLGPMAYVRNLRLCRVRHDLLHPTRTAASVSSAARRWSFTHMGQFSCDYRALFGEMPSTTLLRQRREPARARAAALGSDQPR